LRLSVLAVGAVVEAVVGVAVVEAVVGVGVGLPILFVPLAGVGHVLVFR